MIACLLAFGLPALAQPDVELTDKEKAYQDSIAAINAENEQNSASREVYNEGISLFEKKDFKAAIGKFNEAIKIDPEFKDAYYNKGVAELEAKQYKAASATFSDLISKEKSAKALFQRARAYQSLNDYSKAEYDYSDGLYDSVEKEFSGFKFVTELLPDGSSINKGNT